MFNKKTVKDIDVQGKLVLVRVDFNVPIKDGRITDDTRIQAALPTIKYLLAEGASLILCSHLGRPKNGPEPAFSLKPVAEYLGTLISEKIYFATDCIGPIARDAVNKLGPKEILVLENTRFHDGEKKNDPEMAKELASYADVFVNDAFGTAHRAHASNVGVSKYLPAVAGFLLEKEIEYLDQTIEKPKKPFIAILGGAKVSDKINVIKNLLEKADTVLIGGGMANTFFKAQGYPVADSLVEDDAEGWRILDIGPETIKKYSKVISQAGTVVWNGPMGVFEMLNFAKGTFEIANAVANSEAISIIGGGDSASAIKKSGLTDKISHISTGGGASLEMLEGIQLPGLVALEDK